MAIKIIKEGKKTSFRKTCPDCGCEFEYDATDLQTDYSICLTTYPGQYNTYVVCPCCGRHIHHGTAIAGNWPDTFPNVLYTSNEYKYLDCSKCPNRPDPDHPIVGDSPCSLCPKMQFYSTSK